MKKLFLVATALVIAGYGIESALSAADGPPPWAWGFTGPAPATAPPAAPAAAARPAVDATTRYTVPGSKFSFTRAEVSNFFAPADWFPEDHPPMPEIVAHGRQSAQPPIYACGMCHMPNGKGRPENANLTGLAYEYVLQQLNDFRDGKRKTSDPRKTNTLLMENFAKQMTREEMEAAAKYFAAIPATPWVKVIESKAVPKTRTAGGVFFALEGAEAGSEELGNRIVEMPLNNDDFEMWRNPRSGFTAYVPPGSLKRGEALVKTGAGKVTACVTCHGQDLRGLGPVPILAGRSPLYLARQLYDMQVTNRKGAWAPLMAPVVAGLSADDILAASAYLASLNP